MPSDPMQAAAALQRPVLRRVKGSCPHAVVLFSLAWTTLSGCHPGTYYYDDTSDAPGIQTTPPDEATETPNPNTPTPEQCSHRWYIDQDLDGFGHTAETVEACQAPPNTSALDGDCDDSDPEIHPGAEERCNGLDDGCDGLIDEGLVIPWYFDADGDQYGAGETLLSCLDPDLSEEDGRNNWVTQIWDCVPTDATIHPGAIEQCDTLDNDCDYEVDENLSKPIWYLDADHDGFGDANQMKASCFSPDLEELDANTNWVQQAGDCNDLSAQVYPDAEELCDGLDNDCDGVQDAADPDYSGTRFYPDADGDGFGDPSNVLCATSEDVETTQQAGDCNDLSAQVYPGAEELCDGLDNDCDGIRDDGLTKDISKVQWLDADGDGYGGAVCTLPPEGVSATRLGDCDDSDPDTYPDDPAVPETPTQDCCARGSLQAFACLAGTASPGSYSQLPEALASLASGGILWVFPGLIEVASSATISQSTIHILGIEPNAAPVLQTQGGVRALTATNATLHLRDLVLQGSGIAVPDGGLVHVLNTALSLNRIRMTNGNSTTHGGAIWAEGATSLDLTHVWLDHHRAAGLGGAVYAQAGVLRASNTWFFANQAGIDLEDTDSGGGALYFEPTEPEELSSVDLSNVRFTENLSIGPGGALRLQGSYGPDEVMLENTLFWNNTSHSPKGGAIHSSAGTYLQLMATTIAGNTAGEGDLCAPGDASAQSEAGGLWLENPEYSSQLHMTLENVIFDSNRTGAQLACVDAYCQVESPGEIGLNILASPCEDIPIDQRAIELYRVNSHFPPERYYELADFGIEGPGWRLDPIYALGLVNEIPAFSNMGGGDLHLSVAQDVMGAYAGSLGATWDLDWDGFPDWFWPGTWSNAPTGYTSTNYDPNDLDKTVP